MAKRLDLPFDSDMIESISSDFDLRAPNKEALRRLAFALDGDYCPEVMQVLNLATGVGKTYLMAAFVEYLRLQGVGNVVIVTPGKVVQAKTVRNFSPGAKGYIEGSQVPPDVVTPTDYSAWRARQNGPERIAFGREVPSLAFIFNIQQLIAPRSEEGVTLGTGADAQRRKPRRFDESAGVLFDYLKGLNDLVVIADESHLYSASAAAFNAALRELDPAATIGLTASVLPGDNVIYKYPLYQAIKDEYVKAPVLAFRKDGYGEDAASEEQQLRDAYQLRDLKQRHYDSYAESQGKPHLNAVMFVVCSDVAHATEVASLLRTPEYFGRESAVLQVDSEHDTEATQHMLDNVDASNSPVLAVVSVNKLKEGWDVKNIAVVVTLRAMASEVLTQQTMGRGLRLPFGKHAGVRQIDQLDIIAHHSFEELLRAEDVLAQFGLDEAVDDDGRSKVAAGIASVAQGGTRPASAQPDRGGSVQGASTAEGVSNQGQGTPDAQAQDGTDASGQVGVEAPYMPTVVVTTVDEQKGQEGADLEYITIKPNTAFSDVSYTFPVSKIEAKQPPIDFSEISYDAIEGAAKRVTSASDVLYRKEIVAAVGKKKLGVRDAESAEVDSLDVSDEDAKQALLRLIIDMPVVPKYPGIARYLEEQLVPRFMQQAPVDGWTVKSLDSARGLLQDLVKGYISDTLRKTQEVASVHPKRIKPQAYSLQIGEKVYDPIDSREEFVRGRAYSGWFKSLFDVESFDSWSGEYELARLLNTDPHIVWWHRLHPSLGASIQYTPRDRYYPDFVILDDEGTHWIIEGKDARGRDDAKVQAKRKAAEALVRKISVHDDFAGQKWGYLIAYEDDIAKAESWNDLKALAQPVSNELK